jgi:hypothetical protein
MSDQFLNFTKFLDIKQFAENSILADSSSAGSKSYSNGVLKLNRFVGILDIPTSIKGYFNTKGFGRGNNNELSGQGGWGNDFLAWNCFKVDCPELRIGIESREVDMMPRHYFKNWEYDDLAISYIESADLKIRHFFFEWMHAGLDVDTFQRHYYDDIKSNWFVMYPLDFQGEVERFTIFRDLVPFSINSVNFDVSDDGVATALTTIKFKYYRQEILTLPNDPYKEGNNNNEFTGGNSKFTSIKSGN